MRSIPNVSVSAVSATEERVGHDADGERVQLCSLAELFGELAGDWRELWRGDGEEEQSQVLVDRMHQLEHQLRSIAQIMVRRPPADRDELAAILEVATFFDDSQPWVIERRFDGIEDASTYTVVVSLLAHILLHDLKLNRWSKDAWPGAAGEPDWPVRRRLQLTQ